MVGLKSSFVFLCFYYSGVASVRTLSECTREVVHKPYTGTVAVTNHGIICQAWAAQTPHIHSKRNDHYFPADGSVVGAKNYCRNFMGSGRPWCYTVEPYIIWGYCTLQICNGTSEDSATTMRNPSGVITAPDSDGNGLYDNNIDILWIIEAPENKIVRYKMHYIQIRESEKCQQDGLRVYEASYDADHILHCGNQLFMNERMEDLGIIYMGESTTNVVYVQFYSDYELSATGFEMVYEHSEAMDKHCEEAIRQSTGWISAPDIDADGFYDFNLNCSWIVTVEVNSVIGFQVLFVAIQYSYGCLHADYLEIYDAYAPLSLLCGFGGPRTPMQTRSNVMYVYFVSNNYFSGAGFNVTFHTISNSEDICGEEMHEPSGVIISPDSDGDGFYDNNVNCLWTIEVAALDVIRYRFEIFSLEYSQDCARDVLLIYEDGVAFSKTSYCGHMFPEETYEGETLYNKLYIEFRSDADTQRAQRYDFLGFNITYVQRQVLNEPCGSTLRNSSGFISPPDLDGDGFYDFNVFCLWYIVMGRGKSILYQLYDISIEEQSTGCESDYLRITESISAKDCSACPFTNLTYSLLQWTEYSETPRETVICGNPEEDPIFRSWTNEIKVYFVSDSRFSSTGFTLIYQEVEQIQCGKVLTEDSGLIFPPFIDDVLGELMFLSCEWTIFAKPHKAIEFKVMYVRMATDDGRCEYYLEILFFRMEWGDVYHMRYCYVVGPQVPVQTRSDWVSFYFYSRPKNDEFLISYEQVEGCGTCYNCLEEAFLKVPDTNNFYNVVNAISLTFISSLDLDGDGYYDYNLMMEWRLQAELDRVIMMKILYINIEESPRCYKDFLRITSTSLHHVICGIGTKTVYTSVDNFAYILFVSDYSVNNAGFNITFTHVDGRNTDCGALLTAPSEYIASEDRNGDGKYENVVNCMWTVQLHEDYVIVFKILEIDIQKETSKCKADYLKVREDHKHIGKYCGTSTPAPITTEANMLYIQFVSNIIVAGRGFKAIYFQTEDIKHCQPEYQCLLSDVTIQRSYLCDDYIDCPYGDDERFCDFRCPVQCECVALSIDCSSRPGCRSSKKITQNFTRSIVLPASTRRLDVSSNPEAFELMNVNQQALPLMTYLNLSNCNIGELSSGFLISMMKLKILDISYNRLRRLTSQMFASQSNLESLSLTGNFELITFETDAFSGMSSLRFLELSQLQIEKISQNAFATLNLTTLKIYHSQIFDIEGNSLGGLSVDGIYLNSSKIQSFSESMFHGIHDLLELRTDEFKFCCVRPHVLPQEQCFPKEDEFSSCDDLIRNDILRPLIWIIGVFTIITNFTSIVYRSLYQRDQLKHSYGIFVSNLAVSDGFMGIYLVIIAVADAYFRKEYIFNDDYWRHSVWCKLAGGISTLSTEASVLFICLITLDRLLVIRYPFGQVRLILKYGSILSVLVWVVALITAFLPVVLYPFFEGTFYSQSGVCLALPLSRTKPRGWSYAVCVFIGFNSLAYLLVALGQWSIYRQIKASSKMLAESRTKSRNDARVARNLLLVVATDLLCWLPVGLLGLLAIFDQAIEGEAYSWIAVVVLPVNAAVNPVLYTLSAIFQKKKNVSSQEEGTSKEIFTTGQWQSVWHSKTYWQFPGQLVEYKTLSETMEEDLNLKQRLMLARKIIKALQDMHSRCVVQRDLHGDDIFVNTAKKISQEV